MISFLYMFTRGLLGEYHIAEIKCFLFGNGVFNCALALIFNEYAVGFFKHKKFEFSIFIFGIIYIMMVFCDRFLYSILLWKINITANTIGAVTYCVLHREWDVFWRLSLNDANKAIIYYLMYQTLINKNEL